VRPRLFVARKAAHWNTTMLLQALLILAGAMESIGAV
jgi:hypothetical protein